MEHPEEGNQGRDHGRSDKQGNVPPLRSHRSSHNSTPCNRSDGVRDQERRTEHRQISGNKSKPVIQILELVVVNALHYFKTGREDIGHLLREFDMPVNIIRKDTDSSEQFFIIGDKIGVPVP
jgi:hypothetical protein